MTQNTMQSLEDYDRTTGDDLYQSNRKWNDYQSLTLLALLSFYAKDLFFDLALLQGLILWL
jgi:hypothetical protein